MNWKFWQWNWRMVPVNTVKGQNESDAAYAARLQTLAENEAHLKKVRLVCVAVILGLFAFGYFSHWQGDGVLHEKNKTITSLTDERDTLKGEKIAWGTQKAGLEGKLEQCNKSPSSAPLAGLEDLSKKIDQQCIGKTETVTKTKTVYRDRPADKPAQATANATAQASAESVRAAAHAQASAKVSTLEPAKVATPGDRCYLEAGAETRLKVNPQKVLAKDTVIAEVPHHVALMEAGSCKEWVAKKSVELVYKPKDFREEEKACVRTWNDGRTETKQGLTKADCDKFRSGAA